MTQHYRPGARRRRFTLRAVSDEVAKPRVFLRPGKSWALTVPPDVSAKFARGSITIRIVTGTEPVNPLHLDLVRLFDGAES